MTALRHPWLHWTIGLALGATFLYAAWDKVLDPAAFARIVYHYQLIGPSQHVGPWAANLLAVTLPWIEIVTGLALVSSVWRREGAIVAAGLLGVFIVAVAAALVRGIDIENCGCFSVSGEGRAAGAKLILGDLALLLAALVPACFEPSRRSAGEPSASVELPAGAEPER